MCSATGNGGNTDKQKKQGPVSCLTVSLVVMIKKMAEIKAKSRYQPVGNPCKRLGYGEPKKFDMCGIHAGKGIKLPDNPAYLKDSVNSSVAETGLMITG